MTNLIDRDSEADQPLTFPWTEPPQFGATLLIAPGVHWLRMPLDGRLDHVNIWLLEGEGGWTIVDCGLNSVRCHEIWEHLFETLLAEAPVAQIVATHAHVDHIGYLGNLVEKTGAPVVMTLAEFLTGTLRVGDASDAMADLVRDVATSWGSPPETVETMAQRRRAAREKYSGMPMTFRRAIAGQSLRAGGRDWEISTWGGHSPEMMCLHDPDGGILIAGDQVLSRITPSINVHPTEPQGNPLKLFYESFAGLRALPRDTLVLPSHGMPFYGLHARIAKVHQHHEDRLSEILGFAEDGATPYEIALRAFPRAMKSPVAGQALGETLSHLNLLESRGLLTSSRKDSVLRFQRQAEVSTH